MIFVSVNQRGYTDTELWGPFPSVEMAKQKITNGLEQGLDGDDTRFSFHKVSESGTETIGSIYFYEEYDSNNGLETKKEEYFVIGYEV